MPTADDLKLSMCNSLAQMGDNHVQLGQVEKAIDYFQQALSIARESAEPALLRRIQVGLSLCALRQANFSGAVEYYEQALKAAARPRSGEGLLAASGEALLLIELGRYFYWQGDLDRASAYVEDAAGLAGDLRAVNERGAERIEALAGAYLGIIASGRGDLDRLRDQCSAALVYASAANDDLVAAVAQLGLGLHHTLLGRSGEGAAALSDSLNRLRALNEPAVELEARAYLCWCQAEAGRPDAALELAGGLPEPDDPSAARRVRCVALIGRGPAEALAGRAEEALATCREALTLAQDVLGRGDQLGYRLAGRALCGLGVASGASGRTGEALASYRQALAMTDTVDDPALRLRALLGIAEATAETSPDEARAAFGDVRQQASGIGSPVLEMNALTALGQVETRAGDWTAAAESFSWASSIAEKTGDLPAQARVALLSGDAYRASGQRDLAQERYQRALEIIQANGLTALEGQALGGLGLCLVDSGEPGKAIQAVQYLGESRSRLAHGANPRLVQAILGGLGTAYAISGQPNQAIEQYREAIAAARQSGDRAGEGAWLGNLANLYAYIDQPARAVENYQAAIQISQQSGDRAGEARLTISLGLAYSEMDRIHEAVAALKSAMAMANELGDAELASHAQRFLDQLG